MAADLVPQDPDNVESSGLTPTQIKALDQLHLLGAQPRANADDLYDKNPQIRALQLVYEGRFGGSSRGSRAREERISVGLTEYARTNLGKKVKKALDRALRAEAGERTNLDAIKLITTIENQEAKLQVAEDRLDLENASKEELLTTLMELIQDAQTASAINATFSDITTKPPSQDRLAEIGRQASQRQHHEQEAQRRQQPAVAVEASTAAGSRQDGDPSDSAGNGIDAGAIGANGHGDAASDRGARPTALSEATLRRAAERRRASRLGKA